MKKICLITMLTFLLNQLIGQNSYCVKAIEMLNKGKMDSCDIFLSKAGYYSGNYVNDKSDCFIPFNLAKEKRFLSVLEANPKDGNAAGSVAIADFWLKKYDAAVKYYNLAISIDPKTEWYYSNLSFLYSKKLNDQQKADEVDELFLKNNPESDNYTNAGAKCFQSKDYAKAIKYFKKALVGSAIDHKALNNIGMSFQRLSQCDSAIFYSSKSFELNPEYNNAAENLTEAYNCQLDSLKSKSQIKEFVELYNKMEKQCANRSNYPFNISSNIKYPLTKYFGAVKDLASKPTSEGYCKLAEYLMSEKDFDAAVSPLQTAIKLNPKNGEANFNLGYIYMEDKKDYKKALPLFNAAYSNLAPYKQELCLFNIGNCYDQTGDNTNAIATFKKALVKDQNNKDVHYRLYKLYEKIGDKTNADLHKRRS